MGIVVIALRIYSTHKTEELKPAVQRLLSEDRSLDWDLMLIEHLELDQGYRGQGIGKENALMAIRKLGANCGVITCVPVPLQFTGRCDDRNSLGKTASAATSEAVLGRCRLCPGS